MPALPTTPGVYIEELSLLPPSVAEVSTAIPAFVGYTKKGPTLTPTRITSMMEYEGIFGGPFETTVSESGGVVTVTPGHRTYSLYYQVAMFFRNGGGVCYIVSAGAYKSQAPFVANAELERGIDKLMEEDEPSLLLVPEAPVALYSKILQHCKDRKDRFAILDTDITRTSTGSLSSTTSTLTSVGMVALDYGALYAPSVITDMSIQEDHVVIAGAQGAAPTPLSTLKTAATDADRARYRTIRDELAQTTITLSPGGAIAGMYARVDRERGVWKAPANVGLIGVIAPTVKITDKEQGDLNVNNTSGKSINIIRSFPGKGVLVWGARTLDGNNNEWKYVNVRRLFIMVEESIQKATSFAVFEPNTASTWLKVKTMIESYLYGLWQRGALAGAKPEHAYFVQVGLNLTMTAADIQNGILRVSVGIAAVRPAEFIIITFSHKLQES